MKTLMVLAILNLVILDQNVSAQKVGDPAPDFTLNTIDGYTFQLSQNIGKVVMILFFGDGCPHCLGGGPTVQSEVVAKYSDNFDFLPIGVDAWAGNSSAIETFRSSTGLKMDMCIMGGSVQTLYGLSDWDRIVVVGKDGKIVYKGDAYASQTVKPAGEAIQQALDGGSGTTAINNTEVNKGINLIVYPNPVSDQTNISFKITDPSEVDLLVRDIEGKIVYSQHAGYYTAGQHAVPFNAGNLQSGVYYIVLKTTDSTEVSKFVVY